MTNMKDNKILLLIPLISIMLIMLGIVVYDDYITRKTNDDLKKQIRDVRQECKKLNKEKLKLILKN